MSITAFFVDAFSAALDRGIASAHDIVRHVTPEVLAAHLPRSLWARLLTACLGASRVDATTIVDTVGIANLCEHMPKPLLWTCLADIAATALGGARLAEPINGGVASAGSRGSGEMLLPPPPASALPAIARPGTNPGEATGGVGATAASAPAVTATSNGQIDSAASLFDSGRARTPTRPPGRGLGTSRIPSAAGASTRRPQVAAPAPMPGVPTPAPAFGGARPPTPAPAAPARRDELDFEIETDLRSDWKGKEPIPVDDEQLVDWSANEETASGSSIDRTKR